MTLTNTVPHLAAAILILVLILYLLRGAPPRGAWLLPALISVVFLAWTVMAVIVEGPLGFWTEHSRNLWGNQIWMDLLIAAGIGWTSLLPRAREAGMRPALWLVAVLCSGGIGLSAMLARLLQLEEQARA